MNIKMEAASHMGGMDRSGQGSVIITCKLLDAEEAQGRSL
jgi:hypothetical protein